MRPLNITCIRHRMRNYPYSSHGQGHVTYSLNSECAKYPKCPVWIGGDANLPDIDWSADSIVSNNYNQSINQLQLPEMLSRQWAGTNH